MGFGVWGLGFGVWGLGFGVWGLGFGAWGLGFGVQGFHKPPKKSAHFQFYRGLEYPKKCKVYSLSC